MITTTGPFELSGLAAGVSVEGPIASVSLRLRSTGGTGLEDDAAVGEASMPSPGGTSVICGGAGVADEVGLAISGVSRPVFNAAEPKDAAGSDAISTGVLERALSPVAGRDAEGVCCCVFGSEGAAIPVESRR